MHCELLRTRAPRGSAPCGAPDAVTTGSAPNRGKIQGRSAGAAPTTLARDLDLVNALPASAERCGSPTARRSQRRKGGSTPPSSRRFNRDVLSWAVADLRHAPSTVMDAHSATPSGSDDPPRGLHHPLRPRLPVHRLRLGQRRDRQRPSRGSRWANAKAASTTPPWSPGSRRSRTRRSTPTGSPPPAKKHETGSSDYVWTYNTKRHPLTGSATSRLKPTQHQSSICP